MKKTSLLSISISLSFLLLLLHFRVVSLLSLPLLVSSHAAFQINHCLTVTCDRHLRENAFLQLMLDTLLFFSSSLPLFYLHLISANAPASCYMGDGKKGTGLQIQSNNSVNILNSSGGASNFTTIASSSPSISSSVSSTLAALNNSAGKQSDKVKEKERKRKLKKLINYFSSILLTPINTSSKSNNTSANNSSSIVSTSSSSTQQVEVGTFYPSSAFLSSASSASSINVSLSRELLDYFMKRLASQSSHLRSLSIKALNLILTPPEQSPPTPDSMSNQPVIQQQTHQQTNSSRLFVSPLTDEVTFLLDDDYDDEESKFAQAFPLHKTNMSSYLKNESLPPSTNNQQNNSTNNCLDLGSNCVTFDFLDSLVNCTRNFNLGLKETACESLRWALIVECNPYAICRYTKFLADNSISDGDNQLLETSANLASLLIDRSAVVRILTADESPYKICFLNSCYNIFHAYLNSLEKNITSSGQSKSNKSTSPDNPWANDQILFEWESTDTSASKKLTLNITVVHAIIILLTYGPIAGSETLFHSLMATWFCEPPPTCYLPDTNEEAVFLPDWLRLRMLRSNNSCLVNAAMKDLDSTQLVLFIQSFGLPVKSMERLLASLDESCDEDEKTVRDAIPDEKFMKHLIQVQWMRGAQTGYKFASMLGLEANA